MTPRTVIFLLCGWSCILCAADEPQAQPTKTILESYVASSIATGFIGAPKAYNWKDAEAHSDADSIQAIDASSLHWDSLSGELGRYKNLIYLDLSGNELSITDGDIKCLQQLGKLKYLVLAKNRIDSSGWKRLGALSLPGLVFLNVSSNRICPGHI